MAPKYFFQDFLSKENRDKPLPEDVNSFVIEQVKKNPFINKDFAIDLINTYQKKKLYCDDIDIYIPDLKEGLFTAMKFEMHNGVIKFFKFKNKLEGIPSYAKFMNGLVAFGGKNIKTKILNKGK